jgi:hypothetical protein
MPSSNALLHIHFFRINLPSNLSFIPHTHIFLFPPTPPSHRTFNHPPRLPPPTAPSLYTGDKRATRRRPPAPAPATPPYLPNPRVRAAGSPTCAPAAGSPWSSTPLASNRGAEDLAADRAPLRCPRLRRRHAHRAEGRGERHLPPVAAPSPFTCPGGRIAGSSSSAGISSSPRQGGGGARMPARPRWFSAGDLPYRAMAGARQAPSSQGRQRIGRLRPLPPSPPARMEMAGAGSCLGGGARCGRRRALRRIEEAEDLVPEGTEKLLPAADGGRSSSRRRIV